MSDLIKREDAVDAVATAIWHYPNHSYLNNYDLAYELAKYALSQISSVEKEPISDQYAKAVFTWLLEYQIKSLELKGYYTPYEVLSWVANDWVKENEIN